MEGEHGGGDVQVYCRGRMISRVKRVARLE
jgi:hypothetical protein